MMSKQERKNLGNDFADLCEKLPETEAEWILDFAEAVGGNSDASIHKTTGPHDHIIKLTLMRDKDLDYRKIDMPLVSNIKSETDLVRVLEQAKNCLEQHVSLETKIRGASLEMGQWPSAFTFDEKFDQLESCLDKILHIQKNIDEALANLDSERAARVTALAEKIKEAKCPKT